MTETMAREGRFYPLCCQSAYCGRSECLGCKFKHIRVEFDAWCEQTAAIRPDPIWCPTYYVATRRADND